MLMDRSGETPVALSREQMTSWSNDPEMMPVSYTFSAVIAVECSGRLLAICE